MERIYIVTARSAEDAATKIKAIRAKDGPMFEPTESNYKSFINGAKKVIADVKLDELETKFNEVQSQIQFDIVDLLNDSTTTGNIWWDFKKLIEQDKENADIDMINSKYEEFIKLFESFKEKYAKAGEKLSDATNKSTVSKSWIPWFEKAIDRAKKNLEACYKDAKARLSAVKEKAGTKSSYNTTK